MCADCGLVLEEHDIDRGPTWRSDDEDDDRHTGAPTTRARHDKGLSTEIGYESGADVDADRHRKVARLRREHKRAHFSSKAERNEVYAFTEIRRLVSVLSLSASVREQACTLFDSAQSEGLLSGRSLEGFAAAAVYAVCRTQSIARTIEEVVEPARANRSEFTSAYDAMNRSLGLPVGPIDPTQYLPRYASALDLDVDVERTAARYVAVLEESGRMGGKNPSGVAAACLYQAAQDAGEPATQVEAGELADVSRMTIRSTVSDLEDVL